MLRKRLKNEEDGTAAVEFAIVALLLFTLLFAIIQFGIVMHRYEVYESAAREGARYAAVRCQPQNTSCSAANITDKVTTAAAGWSIGPGTPTATTTCADSNAGQSVTVSWEQSLPILDLPFLPSITSTHTFSASFQCE